MRRVLTLAIGLASAAMLMLGGSLGQLKTASAAGAAFAPGDLIVTGHGVRWLRSDGSLVAQVEPSSFPTSSAAFRASGGTRPLYVVTNSLITRNYGPDGRFLYYFVLDNLAEKATHVALDTGGVGFISTQHGSLNQIFGFKEDPSKGAGSSLVSFFVVASQINDLETASDGCTLLVATKTLGVFRFDACKFTVLPPLIANTDVSRVRLLPDASALLVLPGQGAIKRVDGTGKTIREYSVPGVTSWAAVDLAPDGLSFWAATPAGAAYRIDLASGAVVQGPVQVSDSVTDLAVAYAPLGAAPPPGPPVPNPNIDLDGVSSLTGSTLSGIFPVETTPDATCATGASSIDYSGAFGVAIGPYPGRFEAKGTATVGSQTSSRLLGGLGNPAGPITKLSSTFTIAGANPVVGTLSATAPAAANAGTCATFAHRTFPRSPIFPPTVALTGFEWALSGEALSYQAAISKNGRVYFDAGLAYLYATRYYFLNEAGADSGSGGRYAQYLISNSIAVSDKFARTKQQQPHTAGVPAKTPEIELTTRWTNAKDRFSIVNVRLIVNGRVVASANGKGANKLPVKVSRTKRSVTAHVSGVKSGGRVAFDVKADTVHGHTNATTSVKKRGSGR